MFPLSKMVFVLINLRIMMLRNFENTTKRPLIHGFRNDCDVTRL